jgi:hypothetical protein
MFMYMIVIFLDPFPMWSYISIGAFVAGIAYVAGHFSASPRTILKEWLKVWVIAVAFAYAITPVFRSKPKVTASASP